MYNTIYHRASSTEEAIKLIGNAEDGKFVAGGQTIIPTMKQRLAAPSDLIDLRHIDSLRGLEVNGKSVTIGAATTHDEVASSKELRAVCHAICDLAGVIGDPAVRYMGTLGGSIANNDPAADYPAAIMALDAEIKTTKRSLKAEEFFTGMFETALDEDEIITHVSFTAPDKCGYSKFANPASRYAMAGVFVARTGDNVRVGVTGAGADGVFRHEEMEKALASNWSAEALDNIRVDEDMMLSDIHGSAAYRANLVKVMAKRAVKAAG
jgi:aerobic carbon-monoxide dehydrogenase medium subunit